MAALFFEPRTRSNRVSRRSNGAMRFAIAAYALSRMLRGQLRGYSEARLMRVLIAFAQDVEITAGPRRKAGETGRITFTPGVA